RWVTWCPRLSHRPRHEGPHVAARRCRRNEKRTARRRPFAALRAESLGGQSVADVGEHVVHLLAQHAQDDDDDDRDEYQDQRIFDHALALLALLGLRREPRLEPENEAAQHLVVFTSLGGMMT